jgi:hypothetical protein
MTAADRQTVEAAIRRGLAALRILERRQEIVGIGVDPQLDEEVDRKRCSVGYMEGRLRDLNEAGGVS